MTVREATEQDLEAVIALWAELAAFHNALDDRFGLAHEQAQATFMDFMREGLGDPERLVLVAEVDGEVVGFGHVMTKPTPPIYPRPKTGFITDLAVRADQRRGGLGRALLHGIQAWCAERGLKDLGLGAAVRNPVALGFWSAMGFEAWTQTMVKELGQG